MLPTELYVYPTDIDEDWYDLDEDTKSDIITDYLSDTYGFCHYGCIYEETDGKLHITNIRWDLED